MAARPVRASENLVVASECNFRQSVICDAPRAFEREALALLKPFVVTISTMLVAACGSAAGNSSSATPASAAPVASAMAVEQTAVSVESAAFSVGVNVNTADMWQNSRPFANLIYGTPATMQNTTPWGGSEDIPATNLDANGWVKSLSAGYQVRRGLSIPAAGGDIVCRFQGNGLLQVASGPVSNVSKAAGVTRFTVAPTNPADWKGVTITYFVDPANYIRNIDCREATLPTTAMVAPEFVAALSGFKHIRFVKWSKAEANPATVQWATRNKPGDGDYFKNDGIPVEQIIDTANQAGADPWVNIPWNADDDYITRYATFVRDNMAAGHKVYVETSNEVWNGFYPVYDQACNEAKAANLPSADGGAVGCAGERYAERTREIMQIWTTVFSGQMNRLVRVFAWQHVQPYWSDKLLAYQNTYQYVDALATGAYFGHQVTDSQSLEQIMTGLPAMVNETVKFGVQQKAVAQKYNLRYVTYEGGQHIVMPNNIPLLQQVERDPRMADAYAQYLSGWQSQVGDTLTLFALTSPISRYGAWGMLEYVGQPLVDAPKMRAVAKFLALITTSVEPTSTTTTTQTCADGSIISAGSTCPTSSTTPVLTEGNSRKAVGKKNRLI